MITPRRLSRLAGLTTAVAAMSGLAAALPGLAPDLLPPAAATNCAPQILFLPPLDGDEGAGLTAMSDSGWVVGFSRDSEIRASEAVVWPDTGTPVSLGLGGVVVSGWTISAAPSDVNEHGTVAVDVLRFSGSDGRSSAWLWHDGQKTRLPVAPRRRQASVSAVNDHGVAVGAIFSATDIRPPLPVAWRNGKLIRLPIPRGATGWAAENNNHGLVVGVLTLRGLWRPLWWRIGGRSGPLRLPDGASSGYVVDVDDRGRIVGLVPTAVLWRHHDAAPRQILGRLRGIRSMDDYGHLVGAGGGFRGQGDTAYLARLSDPHRTGLPSPPTTNDPDGWMNTYGNAVSRGVTVFAPQGGFTVGGTAQPWEGETRAVLWTCAQTYLPPSTS